MKVARAEIIPVKIPGDDPDWGFALGKIPVTDGFILKLVSDDGLIGLGFNSMSAHYGASLGGLKDALDIYTQVVIGQDPFNMEHIFSGMRRALAGNNQARGAIDQALYDLQAKALGIPLYALLGGLYRVEIPIIRIVALKTPGEMVNNALKLIDQGYRYIKIKLHGDRNEDITRVKTIRKAVGDAIHLTVDANQSYTPKAAIEVARLLEECGIDLFEQPVRKDDIEGLASVTRAAHCTIEAHESVETLEEIFDVVQKRAADSINISIRHLGGLRQAKIAAAICKLGNVSIRVSATGSRILSAACMHFVASTENCHYACELGEFTRLLDDPAEGLEVVDGMLRVPSLPGIGVSLRNIR